MGLGSLVCADTCILIVCCRAQAMSRNQRWRKVGMSPAMFSAVDEIVFVLAQAQLSEMFTSGIDDMHAFKGLGRVEAPRFVALV